MNDHSSMTPLFHKARAAVLSAYEVDFGTRVVSREHQLNAVEVLMEDDVSEDLATAASVLAVMAAANIDPGAVLADIFLAMELRPDGDALEDVHEIIKTHLIDAGFVAP